MNSSVPRQRLSALSALFRNAWVSVPELFARRTGTEAAVLVSSDRWFGQPARQGEDRVGA
ncbi:hypothetical protein FHU38_001830 [Saccharomonospora amisosensis]|uniref:Uncharacterized protein n=1 Tax=Saccharomonospora amisosensis TaxID=1128677 RepID=A0A7X5ZQI0_9PSEU|nr:hypothetical protein [Saccharomonospora amisosensis]NIJ11486.1 hypothetical protein [Saccharomonospora amisosensis]